jgi:hypothetical protein
MNWQCKFILGILFFMGTVNFCTAQDSSREFWPELDLWYKLTPSLRLSAFIPFSKNVETNYREGSFVSQADYSWGKTKHIIFMRLLDEEVAETIKSKMIRIGYLTGISLDDRGESYSENTALGEYHFRVPIKGSYLLSMRLRADLRWLGTENEFSQRYRYRIMLEKEFVNKKISFVPYVNAETYYDSRYNTFNRYRVIAGTSASWSSRFSLESNFTYQYDSHAYVTNLYAVNVILHVYFQTKRASLK